MLFRSPPDPRQGGAGNPALTSMAEHTLELANADATRELGRRLADELLRQPGPGPALLLLHGELGAGKTCLVQGLAQGLGINEAITSPSFALAQHYEGCLPEGQATHLVHLDLYRLEQRHAADELFAQEEEEATALAAATGIGACGEADDPGGSGAERPRQPGGRPVKVVLAVEWAERLSVLPELAWSLRLEHRDQARRVHWRASMAVTG